ncbi:MFS transporter [Paenibacillus anseongense]|uniref:MFS transporter n=1 Tax=Paenibacillus anseongense TaxID=2682845 RepID=UPI002DB73ED2|nr:MFS transporter [Paenibacillus anseongense]
MVMSPDQAEYIGSAPRDWRIWTTAWLVTAVFVLSNSVTPLYVHWQREMGFSNGTLTLIFAAYIAGLLATLLVAGQISDRYGRKPVLFPGLVAAVLACVLFGTASTVASLLLARLLSGIAVGVIVSAGMASVVDVGGISRRHTASLAASVAMVLGAGLGPLLSGILAVSLTRPVVPLFGIQLLILASAFAVAGSLPRSRTTARNSEWRLRMPSVPQANRLHLILGIVIFAPGITSTSFILSLGPSLLKKLMGVSSPFVAGAMACLMFLSATSVQFLLKKLSIRSQFLIGTLSVFLAMVCVAIAVYTSVSTPLVLAAVLAGIGQGLGQLGGLTLIGLHVPEHRRAEANAVLNIGGYIPAAILPVSTGYLIDYLGLATGASIFAVMLATASVAAAGFVRVKLR